jgi:hypothetical protein
MKTKLRLAAVACLTVFASGCGSSAQDLIIGKWKAEETAVTMTAQFARGGQAQITIMGRAFRGVYKLNGDELEWTMGGKTTKSKVKVTTSEMELTSEGKTITYKRM